MSLRKTPLKRGTTELARRTPLNKIGRKGRQDRREMAAVRPGVLARGCEFRNYLEAAPVFVIAAHLRPIPVTCAGQLDPHHAHKKGQGGSNMASNLICLCRWHHDFTEDEPALCREIGLLR